jgi:hypothetical protein
MRTLLALVPVAASSLLVALFVRSAEPWRSSVLHAAIVWGVTVTALTEAQSLVGLVSFRAVLTGWVAVVALLVIVSPRIERAEPRASRPEGAALGPRSRLLLLSVAVLAAIEGVTAVVAPPNTFDSMTYHMSRVMHWIQNGSLASYPTQIARQLYPPPGAELAILQFQILSGGDRFANLVQWIVSLRQRCVTRRVATR